MAINLQRFFSKFPVIELGDVRLRDLMLADKNEYFAMMSDPEVVKFQSDEDVPTSIEQTESEIKFWGGLFYRKQSVFWAIADADSDKLIGTIGYNSWNYSNRRSEISYDLMQKYWRKGIMTRALTAVLNFGFKNMELYRIEARMMCANVPSKKLLEKFNFTKEGTQRGYRIIRGEPVDVDMYSIIPSDFILDSADST